ncbi:hypothetical protein FRACYDRAFT_250028 [Fragilariopsis cylindrus CCMP1102]|uniref:Uncharacterized protein n=1 Tax=Fragilariopsis cylindrus CCMP1102 TaxID=635003 RepID=A0A1E7EQK5_9STRA|nr:hypothetical protein FRACYDRAFT_250028 [Fragilariopsis cylindrus CCMP1102]|eukprot:OEU08241.1 hypothetical protein FRACYDRAFT_250028 [Fragilariopsis cylindrus CCMP1102]
MSSSSSAAATAATAATASQLRELQQQRQLLVQEKEKHVQLLQQQQQMRAKYNEKVLSPQEQLMQQQHQLLVQQQQQMRAKSLEKEIEKKRQRQLEQENPNRAPRPTSITEKALENPKFIESIMTQPIENIDKCLQEAETSVFDQLYPDSIDYTGEHLMEAFSFQPIIKRYDNEYLKLYIGVDVEELQKQKQKKQAILDLDNCNNDHDKAYCSNNVIKGYEGKTMFKEKKKCINEIDVERLKKLKAGLNDDSWSSRMIKRAQAEIKSHEESRTMFQAMKSTTITQQEHIEQELQEDKKNDNNNNNNVFNELITYYNNGGNGGGGCL